MKSDGQGSSAHDGREFAEHLRTVHFSLVLAVFALLAGSLLTRSSDTKRALADIGKLRDLEAVWIEKWMEAEANKIIVNQSLKVIDQSWLFSSAYDTVFPVSLRQRWFVTPPGGINEYGKFTGDWRYFSQDRTERWGRLHRPRLSYFKDYWNALSEEIWLVFVESLSDEALSWTEDSESDRKGSFRPKEFHVTKISPAKNAKVSNEDIWAYLRTPTETFTEWVKAEPKLAAFRNRISPSGMVYLGHREIDRYAWVLIPMQTRVIKMNGQKAFQEAHKTNFHYGKFEDVFSDLDRITKNYQELDYDKLVAILENEVSRTSDRVEIFGAKIPEEAIATWGSPIVILMQFYLLLHLSAFRLRIPGWNAVPDVAWIGLYPSRLARLATMASIALLPLSGVAFLLVKHALKFAFGWELLLIGIAISASVSIAVLSANCLVRIWRSDKLSGV